MSKRYALIETESTFIINELLINNGGPWPGSEVIVTSIHPNGREIKFNYTDKNKISGDKWWYNYNFVKLDQTT